MRSALPSVPLLSIAAEAPIAGGHKPGLPRAEILAACWLARREQRVEAAELLVG